MMQGIEPEVRTFNTVIIACNMSGQAAEALKVYERMLNVGAQPTATTYTALIRCALLRDLCEVTAVFAAPVVTAELTLTSLVAVNTMHHWRDVCRTPAVLRGSTICHCLWSRAHQVHLGVASKRSGHFPLPQILTGTATMQCSIYPSRPRAVRTARTGSWSGRWRFGAIWRRAAASAT